MKSSRFLLVLIVFLATATAQATIEDEIAQTRERLAAAAASQLDVIAPRHFKTADEEFQEATQMFEKGDKLEDIRKKLSKSNESLKTAEGLQEVGNLLLRDPLDSRAAALASNAPKFAADGWSTAENKMREAGEKVEDGNQKDAKKKAAEANALYREAELTAIRTDVLGRAREERRSAVAVKAEERARKTLAAADKIFADAESVLKSDRYDRQQAKELAEQATREYRRASRIADKVQWSGDDREKRTEELMLEYEAELSRVAEAANISPDLSGGPEPVAAAVVARVESLSEDRASLDAQLQETQIELAEAQKELGSLRSTLENRNYALEERARRDQQLKEARKLFADDAEVVLKGNSLIVRLYALNFPVNSSEIRPENFGLLTKVQRLLRDFPGSPVVVEGHTDSSGDDDYNQALSLRRAEAVRSYLLANMTIEDDLVRAVGYGESRPLANNETEAGRTQNRRIDVVLELPQDVAG